MNNVLLNCHHGGKYSVINHNLIKMDFSSNINPLGISKRVLNVLKKKYSTSI